MDAQEKVVPVQTMNLQETKNFLHLAEKQIEEFAQIYVENCPRFQDNGQWILLKLSTTATCQFLLLMLDTRSLVTRNIELHCGRGPILKKCFLLKEIILMILLI